jgi:hypothetical protein
MFSSLQITASTSYCVRDHGTRITVIMPAPKNVPKLVLAAAVTSITIAGTLYGASIKTEQEVTQV